MKPTLSKSRIGKKASSFERPSKIGLKDDGCPSGTVPIKRVTTIHAPIVQKDQFSGARVRLEAGLSDAIELGWIVRCLKKYICTSLMTIYCYNKPDEKNLYNIHCQKIANLYLTSYRTLAHRLRIFDDTDKSNSNGSHSKF